MVYLDGRKEEKGPAPREDPRRRQRRGEFITVSIRFPPDLAPDSHPYPVRLLPDAPPVDPLHPRSGPESVPAPRFERRRETTTNLISVRGRWDVTSTGQGVGVGWGLRGSRGWEYGSLALSRESPASRASQASLNYPGSRLIGSVNRWFDYYLWTSPPHSPSHARSGGRRGVRVRCPQKDLSVEDQQRESRGGITHQDRPPFSSGPWTGSWTSSDRGGVTTVVG